MRFRFQHNRGPVYLAAAVLAAALAIVPTPYSLILPGHAVDLHGVVAVSGHAGGESHLYMTDVRFIPRVHALGLVRALIPGARLLRSNDAVPSGQTANEYEDTMREAMSESQEMATIVAERAAGLHVPVPRGRLMVVYFSQTSRSKNALKLGDMLLSVNGQRTPTRAQVHHALANVKPGSVVPVKVLRRGQYTDVNVPTMNYDGRSALGVYLTMIFERPRLPVPVAFHLPKVSGSSAGLMFALDIYRSITGARPNVDRVAGTGTIAYDGSVGAIEGARQKVVAAQAAGAQLFIVPADNYAEVRDMTGIRIVPVNTFDQALHAIGVQARKPLKTAGR